MDDEDRDRLQRIETMMNEIVPLLRERIWDQENRLRVVERWKWGIPAVAVIALIAAVSGIALPVGIS